MLGAQDLIPPKGSKREEKCRQEERQCHKAWMKLDYFPLKYLREPGEGGKQGHDSRGNWKEE